MWLFPTSIKDEDLLEVLLAIRKTQGERNGVTKGTDPVMIAEGRTEARNKRFHNDRIIKNRLKDINQELAEKLQAVAEKLLE